jgi:uncharacterized membrane protein YkoI
MMRSFMETLGVPSNHVLMKTLLTAPAYAVMAAVLLMSAAVADDGAQRARDGVRSGQLVPLDRLLERARRDHPGEVLEVELDDGEYEIEILREDGRVVELTFDARSGQLLESEFEDDGDDD